MKRKTYLEQVEISRKKIHSLERRIGKLGSLRVVSFLGMLGSLIIGLAWQEKIYYLGIILFLGIFIILIRRYNQLNEQKQYEQAKQIVLEENLKRLDKGWLDFEEDGSRYADDAIPRIKDLDLLGKGSVFQYLCVAHTPYGKKALAQALVQGVKQEEIKARQEAIKELAQNEEFALHLKTLSQLITLKKENVDEASIAAFIEILGKKKKEQSKWLKVLSLVIPFVALFSVVVIVLNGESKLFALTGSTSITMQIGLAFFYFRKHSELFDIILRFSRNINVYKNFLLAIEEKEFESSYLKLLKQSICEEGGPKEGLDILYKLSEALKVRLNAIAYMMVAGLLMWDFHCNDVFDMWCKQYGKSVDKWLSVMGEIEALLSLAVLCDVKEEYSFPEVAEKDKPAIRFSALKHPLIQEAIGNDLDIQSETCIITGSNMSGKTTFLRTIGVNLALAYAGAPVLAKDFFATRMEVQTSMRMQDDVNAGISSFYAELLRIKGMIDTSHTKRPMLALIDEIFKGTNSADRILGAKETINALEQPWVIVMVSTHDFELCELEMRTERKRKVYNYHFEEYYQDNRIGFDYKLKKGRCRTTNAQFLLKMVGITR